jgi:hypothetical protein
MPSGRRGEMRSREQGGNLSGQETKTKRISRYHDQPLPSRLPQCEYLSQKSSTPNRQLKVSTPQLRLW